MDGFEKFKKQIEEHFGDKGKSQAASLIGHLEDVCDAEYDALLAQEHKTFQRMWKFIEDKAREVAVNGSAFVEDPDVYGWMDEYAGLDDKAEYEKKAAEAEPEAEAEARPAAATTASSGRKAIDSDMEQLTLF